MSATTYKVMLAVVTSTNTLFYEVAEVGDADPDPLEEAGDLTLVGVSTNGVEFAAGDIVLS